MTNLVNDLIIADRIINKALKLEKLRALIKTYPILKPVMDITYMSDKPQPSWHSLVDLKLSFKSTKISTDQITNLVSTLKDKKRADLFTYLKAEDSVPLLDITTRILKRSIVSGMSEKTVLTNIYGINFLPLGLCAPDTNIKTVPPGEYIVEPKLDGFRGVNISEYTTDIKLTKITKVSNDIVSRGENPLNNCDLVLAELEQINKYDIFDGELYADTWEHTNTIVTTETEHADRDQFQFWIFDQIPKSEWSAKKFKMSLRDRKDALKDVFSKHLFKYLKLVPYELFTVTDKTTDQDLIDLREKYIKLGYEGAVIKKLDSAYPGKKTKAWQKLKQEETIDAIIVSFVPGYGKFAGLPGGLKVEYKGIISEINGMDMATMEDMITYPDKYLGKTCELKCQNVTSKGKLRSGKYRRMRPDKDK